MNKVKFGLKNTRYAVITESNGSVQYGTPKAIPGAVSLTQSANGESVVFYADDMEYYSENTNNGYDGALEMAIIPDSFRVDVFGDTLDSNGVLIENKDAVTKKIALMYEFNGDVNKTRHVNYNVKVSRPNIDATTTTNTRTPKTESMNVEVRPAIDTGDVKGKVEQDKAAYETFFSAVYLKNAPTNTVTSSTATFSKAAPADITIDSTSSDATNKVKNVMKNGLNIGGAYLTVNGVDVTIESAYIATLANGTYTITVEFERGNTVTVALTVAA
nr:major tail protein [uncultured Aminipila sp.]